MSRTSHAFGFVTFGLLLVAVLAFGLWKAVSWAQDGTTADLPRGRAAIMAEIVETEARIASGQEELDELQAKKTDLQAKLATLPLGTERDEAKKAFEERTAKIEALEKELVELQDKRLKLKEELEKLPAEPATTADLEQVVANTASAFEAVQARIDAVDGRVDGVETKVHGLNDRVDQVETRVGSLEEDVRALQKRLADAEGRITLCVTAEQARTIAKAEALAIRDWAQPIHDEILEELREPSESVEEASARGQILQSFQALEARVKVLEEAKTKQEASSALQGVQQQTQATGTVYYSSPCYRSRGGIFRRW